MSSAHWVVCKECGKKFDVSKKGGYYNGTRYTCKSCARKIKTANKGEKDSWFKRYWKLLFGVFFLIGGFGNIGKSGWDTVLISLFLGIALLFWHFYPSIRTKKDEDSRQKAILKSNAEKVLICSKCGARVVGNVCEYCGNIIEE